MEDKKEDMSKEGEEAANSFEDILPPSPEDIRCLFNSDLNLDNHIRARLSNSEHRKHAALMTDQSY